MLIDRVQTRKVPELFGADAFRGRIYVGENGIPSRVYSCDEDTLSDCKVVYSTYGLFRFTDMRVYHSSQQPMNWRKDDCADAGCSHLCVLIAASFKCVCPNGMDLGSNGKTCKSAVH